MPKKQSKRKLDPIRTLVLSLSALALVLALGNGVKMLIPKSEPDTQEQKETLNAQPVSLDENEQADEIDAKPVDLLSLRSNIEDVFDMKDLENLKSEVQSYLFNNQLAPLKEQILKYLEDNKIDQSKIAWAIQDLTTDAFIESDNAATNFIAASTYKLPLTMLYYEMVANGSLSMDTKYLLTENMLEKEDLENPNQPIGRKYKIGDSIPLSELLEAAALYSDNIAGHILFENLGGYSAYKVQAQKYSDAKQDKEFTSGSNVLNPDYTMDLVHYLYNTTGTFDDLKYWLYAAGPNMFLNRNYPYGYVQKVGNLEEHRNVIGYLPGEFPYSVSIYSEIGVEEGEKVIGDIGQICYNYFYNRYLNGDYYGFSDENRDAKNSMHVQEAALHEYASDDYQGDTINAPASETPAAQ